MDDRPNLIFGAVDAGIAIGIDDETDITGAVSGARNPWKAGQQKNQQ